MREVAKKAAHIVAQVHTAVVAAPEAQEQHIAEYVNASRIDATSTGKATRVNKEELDNVIAIGGSDNRKITERN